MGQLIETQGSIRTSIVHGLFLVCLCLTCCAGCSRSAYREWADRDAYGLVRSRQFDTRWVLPKRTLEAAPQSRLADAQNPDCGPLPPDDPAAHGYMKQPFRSRKEIEFWDNRGMLDSIDDQSWLDSLPRNPAGEVELDKQLAIELALLHSREFQTQVEQLYTSALRLSQNRFEYRVNWLGGSDTAFAASGDRATGNRNLGTTNQLGLTRNFAAGGQFFSTLVNSFTWQFGGGGNSDFAAGNLLVGLTQPLLRGAFRHVRTESLTQAERDMLYQVRAFARFRRQFYFEIVGQYLALLSQSQSVRIEEGNLRNLELNLEEHQVLLNRGLVSPIQVDQVFQSYQTGRLSLINSQQAFQTSMDRFKFQLGLPARVTLKLDTTLLASFELNSTEIEDLQAQAEDLLQSMMKYLPPDQASDEFLKQTYEQIKTVAKEIESLKPQVDAELKQFLEALAKSKPDREAEEAETVDYEQQVAVADRLEKLLEDLNVQMVAAKKSYSQPLTELSLDIEQPQPEALPQPDMEELDDEKEPAVRQWEALQQLIARPGGLRDRIDTLFLVQTQIRLFLIEIKRLELEQDTAIDLALNGRLDLMNSRASVVDSYRQVEIAANRLKSDLSVSTSANLRTDPTRDNAFRFDGKENQYNVGVGFDGPLNRFGERNAYRVAQIAYQQQRRSYMADEDAIVNSVRLNLRQLQNSRFNFQIARQQLITATRQVEQAQFNLRTATAGDSSLTQDLLQALQTLRDTKNRLISNWIGYETSRIALFVDLELLNLDEQGVWINEQENFEGFNPGRPADVSVADDETDGNSNPDADGDAAGADADAGSDDSGNDNDSGVERPTPERPTFERPDPERSETDRIAPK